MAEKSGGWQAPSMGCTYGLPAEVIAERCGVDVSTARRWKSGATRIPRTAEMILEQDLGAFSKRARGWKIKDEELISPEGWAISLSDVLAVPLMRQQIAAYQTESRIFRGIEPQPEAGSGDDALAAIRQSTHR